MLAEVALAVMLVMGAGLATKSFARLIAIDPGYRAENVIELYGDQASSVNIQSAFVKLIKTELDPSKEIVVALGDKAHLDKAFAEAGIKDVKIVEPDYK